MSNDMILIFMIALALFGMQGVGGYFQIQDYKKAVRRVHQYGNVGIGQKKGRLLSGNLVLVACDAAGTIRRVEVMEGLSFLTKFREKDKLLDDTLIDKSIYQLLEQLRGMEKKKQKYYKGYIQALEALELRFKQEKEAA